MTLSQNRVKFGILLLWSLTRSFRQQTPVVVYSKSIQNHVYIEFRKEIPLKIHPNVFLLFSLSPSLREKYGKLYSMKVGSFKTVVAEDAASVKEVLVKKSADYAGRPPFHSFVMTTLGM